MSERDALRAVARLEEWMDVIDAQSSVVSRTVHGLVHQSCDRFSKRLEGNFRQWTRDIRKRIEVIRQRVNALKLVE